jgi:hypothetical protein
MLDTHHMQVEIDRGDEQMARLRRAADCLELDRNDPRSYGLLNTMEYHAAIVRESGRCDGKDDALTLVEIRCYPPLTRDAECGFAKELLKIASRPGDVAGRLSREQGRYGVGVVWSNEGDGPAIAHRSATALDAIAPGRRISVGYKTLRAPLTENPAIACEPFQPVKARSRSFSAARGAYR